MTMQSDKELKGGLWIMENENNNMNQGSTYHFGRNESPFGKEDISGRPIEENQDVKHTINNTSQEVLQGEVGTKQNKTEESNIAQSSQQSGATYYTESSYQQGNVYGQGIHTGEDLQTAESSEKQKKVKKKKEKRPSGGKGKKVALFVCSAAAFGLIAGSVMVGVNALGNKYLVKDTTTIQTVETISTSDTTGENVASNGVADVAQEVMPSIVAITNTSVQTVRSWFQSYEQEVSGSGSGIIIGQTDKEILIATNNHVIEGAKELTVAFFDETAVEATVKGADSASDLAVIAVKREDVDESTLKSIRIATLGESDNLRVGESAIAIGNALGYGQSVTVGYISAVNREVDVEDTSMTLLQTDAAINPGNSGGALLNAKGEVIGINTVKFVDSTVEGMGYAIPISSAIPIINDLMNQEVIEESEQGYLGIQGNDITDEYAQGFNMPKGVYVVKIIEGSPADGCGLKAGDIVTKFANRDVTSMETLQNILSTKKAGEEIEMTVQRNTEKGDYEEIKLTVVLGAKKDMPEQEETNETKQEQDYPEESYPEESYPEEAYPEEFFDPFSDFFNNW